MVAEIWVNIGSGNGLLPDGTKPLPEPMLTDHQWSPVTFILGKFHKRCLNHQSLKCVRKLHAQNFIQIYQGPMSWYKNLFCDNPKHINCFERQLCIGFFSLIFCLYWFVSVKLTRLLADSETSHYWRIRSRSHFAMIWCAGLMGFYLLMVYW